MLLYSRKKVRYRRDGYCWKKRKDGKTTREDHMKLKVQGTEVSSNKICWRLFFVCFFLSLSLSIVLCVLVLHFINRIIWMIYIHWFERLDRVQPNGIAIIFATSSIQFNLDPDEKEACKISASENRIWSETFSKSHLIRLVDQISHKNPHNFTNNKKNRRKKEKNVRVRTRTRVT